MSRATQNARCAAASAAGLMVALTTPLPSPSEGASASPLSARTLDAVQSADAQRAPGGDIAPAPTNRDVAATVARHVAPLVDSGVVPRFSAVAGVGRAVASQEHPADAGAGEPPALYEMGSITKLFTAALLAEMSLRGEVQLDTPLADLLPEGTAAPVHAGGPIRLWHLATHTSGLPRMPGNMPVPDPDDPYAGYDAARLYAFVDGYRLTRPPGSAYEYSNLGSGLLGQVLADRAGTTFERLLDERILRPLGLRETMLTVPPAMDDRIVAPTTQGLPAARWDGFDALAPCGGLVTTIDDLARFARANLEADGVDDDPDVARVERALLLTHKPRFRDPASGIALGLGWHAFPGAPGLGPGTLTHNGMTGGYSSSLLVNRERQTFVAVLAGAAEGAVSAASERLVRDLASAAAIDPLPVRPLPQIDPDHLERLTGVYENALGTRFEIERFGGRLAARLVPQPRQLVVPVDGGEAAGARTPAAADHLPRRFRYLSVDAELAFEFAADATGPAPAIAVTLHQGGRSIRVPRAADVTPTNAPDGGAP